MRRNPPGAQLVEVIEPVRGLARGTRGYVVSHDTSEGRVTLAVEGAETFLITVGVDPVRAA